MPTIPKHKRIKNDKPVDVVFDEVSVSKYESTVVERRFKMLNESEANSFAYEDSGRGNSRAWKKFLSM